MSIAAQEYDRWDRRDWLALGAVALVAMALHWPFVLRGRIPLNTDWLTHHFEPWRSALRIPPPHNPELDDPALLHFPLWQTARRMMRAGHWPLWNPDILCGVPLLADTMSNPLDPLNLVTLPLPDDVAWGMLILLHFIVAGAGAYAYLRHLRACRAGAFAAAACYMLNGFFIVWMELRFVVACFCWMHWVLLCVDRAAQTVRLRWALLAGLLYAFQILAGNLHFVLNLTLLLGAYAAFRLYVVWRESGMARMRNAAGVVALGLAFGVCVSAPQWSPTYELTSLCARSGEKYRGINLLHPAELIAFVAPKFFGHPVDGDFVGAHLFGRSYLTMNSGYVGAFALPFLLIGALCARRSEARFFTAAAVAIVAFLLALGIKPFHDAVSALIAIDTLDHHRLIVVYAFCAATLVGFGVDYVVTRDPTHRAGWAYAALATALTLAAATVAWSAALRTGLIGASDSINAYLRGLGQGRGMFIFSRQAGVSLVLVIAGCGAAWCWLRRPASQTVAAAALICLTCELLYFGTRYNPYVPRDRLYPSTPTTEFVQSRTGRFRILGVESPTANRWKGDVLPPSAGLPYGIADVRGKEGMYPLRTRRFMETLKRRRDVVFAALVHFSHADSRIFDLLNVRYVLSDRALDRPWLRPAFERELHVYENKRCLPRAFTCDKAIVFDRDADLVQHMHRPDFDPLDAVLLDAPQTPMQASSGAAGPRHVEIIRYEPNRVEVSVDAPRPCYLVLADANYPGWRATVDGKPATVRNAYYLLRSVAVPAGKHKVVFEYWPLSFQIGLALSCGALALLAIGAVACVLKRKA